jgi:hypothetical protein
MSPAINTTKYIPEERFGANLDTFIGKVDENGTLLVPQSINKILDFTGVKKIDKEALYYIFYNNREFSKVLFPDLEQIDGLGMQYAFQGTFISGELIFPKLTTIGGSACSHAFSYCNNITSIAFPVLVHADESYSLDSICYQCINLSSISFPLLETVGLSVFRDAFRDTLLSEVSFPNLTTIGGNGFNGTFRNCQNLTTALFPKLKSIGISGFQLTFYNCKNLLSISFPELIEVQPDSFSTASAGKAFGGCTALAEIHFRADMQSAIEALNGYSDKFGATNATIYFDL